MELEDMVDIARYGSLLGHLVNNPDIDLFMAVTDPETNIWEVGKVFMDGDIPRLTELMEAGAVAPCANLLGREIMDTGKIPKINSVECLYLPPIYLVKDRGVPHV